MRPATGRRSDPVKITGLARQTILSAWLDFIEEVSQDQEKMNLRGKRTPEEKLVAFAIMEKRIRNWGG